MPETEVTPEAIEQAVEPAVSENLETPTAASAEQTEAVSIDAVEEPLVLQQPAQPEPYDDTVEGAPKARWYIVHTYSGFENRVEQTIKEMMRTAQDKGYIKEVVIPTEKVIELVRGEKKTFTRKFYPGYVMVRMQMNDFSWHLVQSIPKVTGFVGGKNRPTPMRDSEADRIRSLMESRQEQPRPKFNFERGDDVRVIDGPFGGFNGVVEDVNYDKGKLRVSVSIFGRQTPVELDFVQVSKG